MLTVKQRGYPLSLFIFIINLPIYSAATVKGLTRLETFHARRNQSSLSTKKLSTLLHMSQNRLFRTLHLSFIMHGHVLV